MAQFEMAFPKEAEKIRLRKFLQADAKPLADTEFDPDVKRYLSLPRCSRQDWLRDFSAKHMPGYAVEFKPSRELAGHCALYPTEQGSEAEIRIVIGKPFWGEHLGRRAAGLLLTRAFDELSLDAVLGITHPKNKAGKELLQDFNFTFKGIYDEEGSHWQSGHLIYRLEREVYNKSLQRSAASGSR